MRSITTTLAMDDLHSARDQPFPLDPSLQQPVSTEQHLFTPQTSFADIAKTTSSSMDLQYILSPTMILEEPPQQHQANINNPQLVLAQGQALSPRPTVPLTPQPVPSSSSYEGGSHVPLITRRPGEHVHPNPDDAIITFDSKTRSFPRPPKPSIPPIVDPYAEAFLRDVLGIEKWEIFSSRLFERRLSGKGRGKGKGKPGDDDDVKSGVSAIEFLVKVEVVKEILRTYVPHPYNPLKSLTHQYPGAPSGQVTLTRSTVLHLSGWSNTQFSYWARRAEAVSVLAEHDSRLHAVGAALERRLHSASLSASGYEDLERDEGASVTGKGLDVIVDEVKKRTGKSQFLRGKHSSLDPYGTTIADLHSEYVPPPTQFAMPTFQADLYDQGSMQVVDLEHPLNLGQHPLPVGASAPQMRRAIPSPLETALFPLRADIQEASPTAIAMSDCLPPQTEAPSPRATRSSTRKTTVASDNNAHHFPLSNSRSEVENPNAGGKRKPGGPSNQIFQKRARTILSEGES